MRPRWNLSGKSVAVAIAVLGLAVFVAIRYTEVACRAFGGHWGSVEGLCTTRLCHYRGSCGRWLRPMVPCRSVRLGTSYAVLHFWFGEPTRTEEGKLFYEFGKMEMERITVTLRDGKVAAIQCGTDG